MPQMIFVNPQQDRGFVYSRALADPDGYICVALWMDPAAVPGAERARNER